MDKNKTVDNQRDAKDQDSRKQKGKKPIRRLFRSRKERVFGGVCGGLARYFNVDPFVMRVIFVLGILLGGIAIIVYLIMWLAIPLERT